MQAFTKWLDEEEGKQREVAAYEEPVLQSSSVSARVLQLRSAFEKLNKKKKPVPPPAPKQEANTTGETACQPHACQCTYCGPHLEQHILKLFSPGKELVSTSAQIE